MSPRRARIATCNARTLRSLVPLFTATFVALLVLFASNGLSTARAQDAAIAPWQPTGLTAPAERLFTPTSGALFARSGGGLVRSDDAGTIWKPIALPAVPPMPGLPPGTTGAVEVDPTNHAIIYKATADGMYKTSDDAQTWTLILPTMAEAPWFHALAISPANNARLYVAVSHPEERRLLLLRSDDGGATWATIHRAEVPRQVACTWGVPLLQAPPTDPDRIFMGAACSRNAQQATLQGSRDGGATWTDLYTPKLAEPRWLVVGGATAPGRLVMALNKDPRGGGSLVARSDDDGASWTTTLEFTGGGGMSGGGPDVNVVSLAADPTNPDRMLLGLSSTTGAWTAPPPLHASMDGGLTWTPSPTPDLGAIADVAYGIDGRMVFLATDSGVWRAAAP